MKEPFYTKGRIIVINVSPYIQRDSFQVTMRRSETQCLFALALSPAKLSCMAFDLCVYNIGI